MKLKHIHRYPRKIVRIIKLDGVLVFAIRVLQKFENKAKKVTHRKLKINFLAGYQDILNAKWATHPYVPAKNKVQPPFVVNWVMSPPRNGGGHQNIFRFIHYLESQGHVCRVYLYSTSDFPTIPEIYDNLSKSYHKTSATIEWLDGDMEPADIVFATGWETAYPVFNDKSGAKKFYFVQDFEPYFYPVGSEYILAENTYSMNFHGITAGGWLANKLKRDYGMSCDYYDFGTDTNMYRFENTTRRKEVFFYARPVTARRGFELGIMALQIFHEKMPDYTITLAGWDVSYYEIPFPYRNLKTLALSELSDVYNKCAAALVVSLTNMSLLPLELLAAGVIPVVTDGANNREVFNNKYIHFAHQSPDALAQELIDIVSKKDLPEYARDASQSIKELSWERSCAKLDGILRRQLNG